jgi:hypothetical protein
MSETRQQKVERLTKEGNVLLGQARQLLEEERDEVARPKLRAMLGKCFRFRNAYSGSEKWWLYAKIVGFDEKNMTFTVVQWEHPTRQSLEFRYEQSYNYNGKSRYGVDGWEPVSGQEYEREKRKMLTFVNTLLAQ